MGLFGKKRPLPHYFTKDQVGGLSSLIRITANNDRMAAYKKALEESDTDPEYVFTSLLGLEVLAQKDQAKYGRMDQLIVEYDMSEMAPQNLEQYQGLLSLFLYRAMVLLPKHGRILMPGAKSYDRMMEYLEHIFFPCEKMADAYMRSMGADVERKPLTGADVREWMQDPDNEEFL